MKVLHVLSRLSHSGVEGQLVCAHDHWQSVGVEAAIVGMADGPHPFADALRRDGYEVHLAPEMRSVAGIRRFREIVRVTRPDIVHIQGETAFDALAFAASTCPSVCGLVRTVNSHFRFDGWQRWKRISRVHATRALGMIWVSLSEETAATERRYSLNPTRVVESWVDVDAVVAGATPAAGLQARAELAIAEDAVVVGMIGNCGGAKNHELAARALAGVEQSVHVLHVGHPDAQPSEEREAWADLPDRHQVHHLGPRDDVPALLAACDLTMVPSLYEGLCHVAVESVLAATPLIAADTLGLHWLRDFPHARLVPHDAAAWTNAISAALFEPEPGGIADAVAVAVERFGAPRGVREYAAVYDAAVRHGLGLRPSRLRNVRR